MSEPRTSITKRDLYNIHAFCEDARTMLDTMQSAPFRDAQFCLARTIGSLTNAIRILGNPAWSSLNVKARRARVRKKRKSHA